MIIVDVLSYVALAFVVSEILTMWIVRAADKIRKDELKQWIRDAANKGKHPRLMILFTPDNRMVVSYAAEPVEGMNPVVGTIVIEFDSFSDWRASVADAIKAARLQARMKRQIFAMQASLACIMDSVDDDTTDVVERLLH